MSQRRVLVVDDEATICEAVAARLRAEGFDVVTASDGPAAVAVCEASSPDVLVLDVMLPGFDGLEVCRRVQASRPVPVLMLTARADETDMLIGLGVGADDYLSKPFSMRVLVARCTRCCGGPIVPTRSCVPSGTGPSTPFPLSIGCPNRNGRAPCTDSTGR